MSALESFKSQPSIQEGKRNRKLSATEQDKRYLIPVPEDIISANDNERFIKGIESANDAVYAPKKVNKVNKVNADIKPFRSPNALNTDSSNVEILNNNRGEEQENRKEKVLRVASAVTDFIPVIGSVKMMAESFRGEQVGTGKVLQGKARFFHGLAGTLFLALDITGVGAVASEIGKGILKISERMAMKAVERKASQEILKREAEQLFIRGKERSKRAEEM